MIILQNCSSSQQEVETPQTFRNYISGVGNYSITADDTKTSLRMYAFYRCNNLTSAIISGANKYLTQNVFYECDNLTQVVLQEGVEELNDSFQYCRALTTVKIPNSIKVVSGGSFTGCNALQYSENHNNKYLGNDNNSWLLLCHCEEDAIDPYCKVIQGGAAAESSSLTSVTIPDSVTNIGLQSFYSCPNLTSIYIGSGVEEIGSMAFGKCESLSSISVSPSNERYRAIGNCLIYFSRIILGCNNSTIPTDSDVNEIYADAFSGANQLSTISIPSNITTLNTGAFRDSALVSIMVPDTVTNMGVQVFYNCANLTSATLGRGLDYVPYGCFSNCGSLPTFVVNDNATSIQTYAFSQCTSLASITIPNSVTIINYGAFENCTSLTDIYYGGTMSDWNNVTLETNWNRNTGNYTIHCTDGDIPK